MKKELFSRIFVGLLGGIVISYLITIGISLAIGDGSYYSCVPSLIERFGNEVTAIIIQTVLSAVLGAGFAGAWRFHQSRLPPGYDTGNGCRRRTDASRTGRFFKRRKIIKFTTEFHRDYFLFISYQQEIKKLCGTLW